MELFRSHGITRDPAQMTKNSDGPWYYQQLELGYNYRMTELQAALGVSQMTRLDAYVTRRHQLALRYDELLAKLPVTTPWQHPDCYSALHLYPIRLQLDNLQKSHVHIFESMRAQGVGVNLHYIPIYAQPYYQRMGFKPEDFPQSQAYYREAMSLPMYQTLTDAQQDRVVSALSLALQS
jgi:dTDP-4-amino-4,6-dideoxygalactose transaminase